MLFNEIYGLYFEIIATLIKEAQKGKLNQKSLVEIVSRKGFEESIISIPTSLKEQSWPLINPDFSTNIKMTPSKPITTLERRWLLSFLLDPRIKLFNPPMEGLEDVEPLYSPETVVYFDRYSDGDPYSDEHYIRIFQTILNSIRNKKLLVISFRSQQNEIITWHGIPKSLEYSSKDDKFRLRMLTAKKERTLNIAQAIDCYPTDEVYDEDPIVYFRTNTLTMEIANERNAVERVLLHFSHYKKSAERTDNGCYRVNIEYQEEDSKELVIRILSFGPTVRVIAPQKIKDQLVQRITAQTNLLY